MSEQKFVIIRAGHEAQLSLIDREGNASQIDLTQDEADGLVAAFRIYLPDEQWQIIAAPETT